ncbi:MAG TPA: cupredoxin domain-containing protein [Patescibacteria group bacterium]|nr:cupredoxin domain-containing protein [Patescibacteria group bacterium]
MMKNLLIAFVLLVLAVGGIWYVRGMNTTKAPETASPSSMMPATDSPETTEMIVSENVKEVVIDGSEFTLMPSTLTFKKGETVKLVFKNTGKMPHDWVVDELGIRTKTINGGDTDTIEFTPQQAGTFEYNCSVGQHRAKGMKGTLTVE